MLPGLEGKLVVLITASFHSVPRDRSPCRLDTRPTSRPDWNGIRERNSKGRELTGNIEFDARDFRGSSNSASLVDGR